MLRPDTSIIVLYTFFCDKVRLFAKFLIIKSLKILVWRFKFNVVCFLVDS